MMLILDMNFLHILIKIIFFKGVDKCLLITDAAINIVDNNFIVPDDTFISALDGYLLPLPSATKALEAIRRALEEADVLGYYQTDLDIIADAISDK